MGAFLALGFCATSLISIVGTLHNRIRYCSQLRALFTSNIIPFESPSQLLTHGALVGSVFLPTLISTSILASYFTSGYISNSLLIGYAASHIPYLITSIVAIHDCITSRNAKHTTQVQTQRDPEIPHPLSSREFVGIENTEYFQGLYT